MILRWYATLSHRTIIITLLVCAFMLYFSYTFNACLLSKINRTFRKVGIASLHFTLKTKIIFLNVSQTVESITGRSSYIKCYKC